MNVEEEGPNGPNGPKKASHAGIIRIGFEGIFSAPLWRSTPVSIVLFKHQTAVDANSLLPCPFGDGDDAVDGGDGNFLDLAVGPVDFEGIDGCGLAETEVKARVAGGEIAAAADDIAALAHAVGSEIDGGADGISRHSFDAGPRS